MSAVTPPTAPGAAAADQASRSINEAWISRTLTAGLGLACMVVLIGGVVSLALTAGPAPDLHAFRPEPESLRSVPGIIAGAIGGDARAITLLGALLLVATPIARVALSLVLFLVQRDRLYVAVSAIVLALLLLSLLVGV